MLDKSIINEVKKNLVINMVNFDELITDEVRFVLLVEPEFPIPLRSRNHSNFLPIGLLKIASYLRTKNVNIQLIRHTSQTTLDSVPKIEDTPQLIMVTSIFTYWSKYVKETVSYYKHKYPNSKVVVGGIYASLLPQHCKEYTGCDVVITGTIPQVETLTPAYDLVDVDYQILHTTRGCIRKCGFCGVYKVEPTWQFKKSIKKEIIKKKLIFYDNNILANPYIEDILDELITLKKEKKINYVESQSGFDGRLLLKNSNLANKLREAGFKNPRIAWDHHITDAPFIEKQVNILTQAGYKSNKISIFMIYNYDIPYNEMEEKRVKCYEWNVQITPCRNRPLDLTSDGYNPYKRKQKPNEYYIHPSWNDHEVRTFNSNCRRHNLCIRMNTDYHSYRVEHHFYNKKLQDKYIKMSYDELKDILPDIWTPRISHPLPHPPFDHTPL